MIQAGIFTRYFPYELNESAQRIRNAGFNTVQLDVAFRGMDLGLPGISKRKCIAIRDEFRRNNLPISCISGYTNLVHPDSLKRNLNIEYLKKIIAHAWDLGSPYVVSESGTFNSESDWLDHQHNKTEEGYEECRDVIKEIVGFARDHGVTFLIEPHIKNVIYSMKRTIQLFNDIPGQNLALLMDPTNYFNEANITFMDETLNQIFDALEGKIRIAHAKDVKLEGGTTTRPAAGLGSLNYDLYLSRLSHAHPNIPIMIEHLEESDVSRAKQFLDEKLRANGC